MTLCFIWQGKVFTVCARPNYSISFKIGFFSMAFGFVFACTHAPIGLGKMSWTASHSSSCQLCKTAGESYPATKEEG